MIKFSNCFVLLFFTLCSYAQIEVKSGVSAEELVNTLIGEGVTISNVTINCPEVAYGTFSGNSNMGIQNGIILTTGDAQLAEGPNNQEGAFLNNFSPFQDEGGDLQKLIPDFDIMNVCAIEFDFVPEGDSLSFEYVFGSEEYPEFLEGDFNDVFGFFVYPVNDPANKKNIAVVPGTDLPVSIQTINNGSVQFDMENSVTSCGGPCVNCEYFVCNGNGDDFFNEDWFRNPLYIQYNGYTTILTAGIGQLIPNEKYHIKLAIADAGDGTYDTGVFLAGQSFSTNVPQLTAGGIQGEESYPNAVAGCVDGLFNFEFEEAFSCDVTINFEVGGTAEAGKDYTTFTQSIDIPEGSMSESFEVEILDDGLAGEAKTIELYITGLSNATCGSIKIDTISLTIEDKPVFAVSEEVAIEEGESADIEASGGVSYLWSGSFDEPELPAQTVSPDETTSYEVTIAYGRCSETLTTNVTVSNIAPPPPPPPVCELEVSSASVETCNDAIYTLSFSISGATLGDAIAVTDSEGTSVGTFTFNNEAISVESIPNSQTVLTITNDTNTECAAITFDATTLLEACLSPAPTPCSITVVMGSIASCTKNTYDLNLMLNATQNGETFTVTTANNDDLGSFSYNDMPVQIMDVPIDQTILFISDDTFEDCTTQTIDIFPIVQACVNLVPLCTEIEATPTVSDCTENDFTLSLMVSSNSAGNSFSVFDNLGNSLGIYNYVDVPVTIGPLSLEVTSLTITDSGNSECTTTTDDLTEAVQQCIDDLVNPNPCNITAAMATFNACTETEYSILLTVMGTDLSTSFSVSDAAGNDLGTYNYADMPIEITGIAVSESILTIIDTDSADCTSNTNDLSTDIQTCRETVNSGACSITAVTAMLTSCTETDYTAMIMVAGENTGTSFTISDALGNNLGMFNYANSPVELTGIATTTNIFTITDNDSADCTATSNDLAADIQDCIDGLTNMTCSVTAMAMLSTCTENDYTLRLMVAAQNTGDSFTVTNALGTALGTYNYADSPIEISGVATTNHVFIITDSNEGRCFATTNNISAEVKACLDDLAPPTGDCSVSISELNVVTCDETTLSIEVLVTGTNAGETFNAVNIDGSVIANFTYSNSAIQINNISTAENFIYIIDADEATCFAPVDLTAIISACSNSSEECTLNISAGKLALEGEYICDGDNPTANLIDTEAPQGYNTFYIIHNNNNLTPASLSNTQVYGISNTNFDLDKSTIPCGTPVYITTVIAEAADLANINLTAACTTFGNTIPTTFLCPISVNIEELCNQATGTFILNIVVKGGLPAVEVEQQYDISGDIYNGNSGNDELISVNDLPDGSDYRIVATDNFGCTTTVSGNITCKGELPVELIAFTGEATKNGNLLKWSTGAEIENDFFTIHHSTDGVNYTPLKVVEGAGTTTEATNYLFLDRNAANGTTYYRLSQTDFNGSTTVEGIIFVTRGEDIGVHIAGINPMPFINELDIQLSSTESVFVRFSLSDLAGKLLVRNEQNLISGLTVVSLETQDLPTGLYMLRIETKAGSLVKKVIKH